MNRILLGRTILLCGIIQCFLLNLGWSQPFQPPLRPMDPHMRAPMMKPKNANQNGQNAKQEQEKQVAISQGAQRIDLNEFGTYGVIWFPKNFATTKQHRVMFALHGSNGNAYQAVYHQLEQAKKNNYGIIALQWWMGGENYLEPKVIEMALFKLMTLAKAQYLINPQQIGLETFSRSAANSLEIAYWNQALKHPHYKLVILQSGGIPTGKTRPLMTQMIDGKLGNNLLQGYRFFLYCSHQDAEWGDAMCEHVHHSESIIKQQGGQVVRLIEDQLGGHGGLHNTPAYANMASQAFLQSTP